MSDWARLHGPMQPVTFEQIEVPLSMPPSWAEMANLAGRS
jgi:hypothetical protein